MGASCRGRRHSAFPARRGPGKQGSAVGVAPSRHVGEHWSPSSRLHSPAARAPAVPVLLLTPVRCGGPAVTLNLDGRIRGESFFVGASSLEDASSRSFNKRLALSLVDASNRTRRVVRAEAAAISSSMFMVLKFRLADLRVRDRVRPLELEVGIGRFLPQESSCACPARRRAPERVGHGADGARAEDGRRARQVRGRPGRGPAAHLRQRSDEARVDGRHRACVVRRRFSSRRWRLGAVSGRALSRRRCAAAICGRCSCGEIRALRPGRWATAAISRAWACTERERTRDAGGAPANDLQRATGAASQIGLLASVLR